MALHTDDMEKVQDWGENPPPDQWYHVRFKKVEEKPSANSGEPTAYFQLSIQEEPYVGRVILDLASLQPHALAKLKAYYKACEVDQAFSGGGHDPEWLLDRECYVKPSGKIVNNENRLEVKPHNIAPLREGKPQK